MENITIGKFEFSSERKIKFSGILRTVISDVSRAPSSTVVHAYILVDPDKDNLYHASTIWFSPESYVHFGKWILYPSNILVERALIVPER